MTRRSPPPPDAALATLAPRLVCRVVSRRRRELRDFIEEDVPRFYPELLEYVSIVLLEATDKVLAAFDSELQAVALAKVQ